MEKLILFSEDEASLDYDHIMDKEWDWCDKDSSVKFLAKQCKIANLAPGDEFIYYIHETPVHKEHTLLRKEK